jgi:hypothetical protein
MSETPRPETPRPETPKPKRPIPEDAALALEVIAEAGKRSIPIYELELRLHQRGLTSRDLGKVIRAFDRRGWIERLGSTLTITEDAYQLARDGARRPAPPIRRKQRRVPRIFG